LGNAALLRAARHWHGPGLVFPNPPQWTAGCLTESGSRLPTLTGLAAALVLKPCHSALTPLLLTPFTSAGRLSISILGIHDERDFSEQVLRENRWYAFLSSVGSDSPVARNISGYIDRIVDRTCDADIPGNFYLRAAACDYNDKRNKNERRDCFFDHD